MSDQRPNILWLMTDEQRLDSMGCSGSSWAHTPNLDRVARAGVRFGAAYTPSPVCVSARACILTGRAGSSIGVLNNHYRLALDDPQFLTWTLAANGYQVASFGKHHYNCSRQAFDLEGGKTLGDRVHYFRYHVPVDHDESGVVRYDGGQSPWLFAGRYPGTVEDTPEMQNVVEALAWMRKRDPSRPYLLRLSFNAPHTPVVTPAPFDTLIDPDSIDLPLDWPDEMTYASDTQRDHLCTYAGTHRLAEDQIHRLRQCYYGYVACVDHCFGRLLDELDAMGELENTIVAYVSDHGAHLGDHGFFQKQSYWEASVGVPFFFSGPGIARNEEAIGTPVSAGSLLPTVLDLVGLDLPPQVEYPSLAPVLCDGAQPEPAPVFSEIDYGLWGYRPEERYVMVREGQWKLCLYRDPRQPERFAGREDVVLFDLENDPVERHNLARDPAHAEVVRSLVSRIDRWDRGRDVATSVVVGRRQ